MDVKSLRKTVLNGKKSERVIFAVTPEMKQALSVIATDHCTSVSGLITSLIVDEVAKNKQLFSKDTFSLKD